MDDETPDPSTGELEEDEEIQEDEEPGSQPDQTAASSKPGEGQTVPLSRFKQVNNRYKQAQGVADWYRRTYGEDPEDVIAFREYKAQKQRQQQQGESKPEKDVTPQQQEAVRALMHKSEPGLKKLLDQQAQAEQNWERAEAQMIDDAHDEIVRLAKDSGIKWGDEIDLRLSRQVMLEIRNDPKLMHAWDRRDIGCVAKAFKQVQDHLFKHVGGKPVVQQAIARRKVSKLPTAPVGGATVTSTRPQPPQKEKGITAQTHQAAWDILQQYSQE